MKRHISIFFGLVATFGTTGALIYAATAYTPVVFRKIREKVSRHAA